MRRASTETPNILATTSTPNKPTKSQLIPPIITNIHATKLKVPAFIMRKTPFKWSLQGAILIAFPHHIIAFSVSPSLNDMLTSVKF